MVWWGLRALKTTATRSIPLTIVRRMLALTLVRLV
jgi:hypothetical protein